MRLILATLMAVFITVTCPVYGNGTLDYDTVPIESLITGKLKESITNKMEKNKKSDKPNLLILDYTSSIKILNIEDQGVNLFVEVEEMRTYFYNEEGPETISKNIHIFRLFQSDGQWTADYVKDGSVIDSTIIDNTIKKNRVSIPSSKKGSVAESDVFGGNTILSSYTYCGSCAANYASKYALNPYDGFVYYPGADCTNFTSQALWFGGWSMDFSWPNTWYYNFGPPTYHSNSWSVADIWNSFFFNTYRGHLLTNKCFLSLGDMVQADWNNDGNIDHSMMVTYKSGCTIKVSYHSNNTLNKPLDDLLSSYPNATFYYLGVY